ncbi:hypothetical protein BKP35_12895 [Anaerobacillus arseniciselenatis]|uniref:Phosphonate ABC transporter substrate-binding protein n=1 Tax=Anaerobacillus arseniciselenatis TaxID=85682 RepID=A0A1S2LF30_9BACI|nr:phosphate/phosphite/phosphonate ABC transporter substrate-binding protein [Anaerobacillus arseniciselenatis]OIJ10976.1 hypothetical protein BKP35_12895 [Anaerobacillus arseniciselenatis]
MRFRNMKILFIAMMLLLTATACSDTEKSGIPLAKEVAAAATNTEELLLIDDDEETFKIAIASILSIRETHRTYNKFLNYIERELGMPVEIVQKQTYSEIKRAFERGEVDAGIVCAYLAVLGNDAGIFESVAKPIRNDDEVFKSYIIVKKDADYQSLLDLKDKSFAFSDPLSYSGFLFPNYELRKSGYDVGNFFEKTYFTYSHDNTIVAVANGLVDGGSTHSDVYKQLKQENDPIIDEIKIIGKGPDVGNSPLVVRPDMDEEIKERLVDVVLSMHESNYGNRALKKLNVDHFIKPAPNLYEPINEMLVELGETK